jgi:alpha-D-xyloside xylohydrolase
VRPAPHNVPDGFAWITRMEGWSLQETMLTVNAATSTGEQAVLTFEALDASIWRWTIIPPGSSSPPGSGMVIFSARQAFPLNIGETEESLVVTGPSLTLVIQRDPWTMRFLDAKGSDIFRENPADIDGLGRPFVLPLGYVRPTEDVRAVTLSFHIKPDECLFGLGEKFTPLDKSGQRIITWTQDAFGSTSERSHKNVPFLFSTRGYGLLLDTGARITWDLGTVSCQSATFSAEAGSLRGYIFAGNTPADILSCYADLTGHAPVPPKWSFGLWVSSGGTYRDRKTLEELVDGLNSHHIPADVVHVDPWWMKWRRYCDFRWDTEAFPDPEGFVRMLHERGLKLCLWEHPYISVESDLYQAGVSNGYFVKRPDGQVYVIDYGLSLAPRPDGVVREATPQNSWNARVAIVDLTNVRAYDWFQDLHRPLLRMGVDVFKTDFGEDIPADALFSNGQTGAAMHNLYPLLYNSAVAEVTREERGYTLVWGRAGTAGSQRTPVCWSGDPAADFESLACTIRGGISIGLSGIPFWSNDIGGYRGKPDPDVYVRWAQFGLLCSHSRMHGDSPREPWQFGDTVLAIVRKYVNLRYQLFPYIYSCAYEASRTGMPVLRAMPLVFPGDVDTYHKDFQFMLGPSLLVAPIIDRSGERPVYLPDGEWMDYWSGTVVQGPRTFRVSAPLGVLPLFLRGGAIIPQTHPADRIPQAIIDPLVIEIFPSSFSAYEYREDEGVTGFAVMQTEREIRIEWAGPLERRMLFKIRSQPGSPRLGLSASGKSGARQRDPSAGEDGTTEVDVPRSAGGILVFTYQPER